VVLAARKRILLGQKHAELEDTPRRLPKLEESSTLSEKNAVLTAGNGVVTSVSGGMSIKTRLPDPEEATMNVGAVTIADVSLPLRPARLPSSRAC
jgi:hypothetical protein